MRFGAKRGSSSLRNLAWSGGSICRGISGRICPIATASAFDENTSGVRSTVSTSSWLATAVTPEPPRSIVMTGAKSRIIL